MGDEGPCELGGEIAPRWDRVGARLDSPVQRLLAPPAERLAELAAIQAGERVLERQEGHAEHLDFPDSSFDAAIWGLRQFFLPDPLAGLRESWRVLKPGGRVVASIPGPTSLEPLLGLYVARLRNFGIAGPDGPGRRRFEHPELCRDALREAGFQQIEVRAEQFGRYLGRAGEWWEIIRSMGFGSFLEALAPGELSQFEAEHLAEVESLATSNGIWLDLAVIFALGWKRIGAAPRVGGSQIGAVSTGVGNRKAT